MSVGSCSREPSVLAVKSLPEVVLCGEKPVPGTEQRVKVSHRMNGGPALPSSFQSLKENLCQGEHEKVQPLMGAFF